MTRIIETQVETQKSSEYGRRIRIAVITSLYFYEIVYRFPENQEPHMTISRTTYGNIHEIHSGNVLVLGTESAALRHAKKTVHNIEKRTPGIPGREAAA